MKTTTTTTTSDPIPDEFAADFARTAAAKARRKAAERCAKAAKPPHPADVYDAQQIARAVGFSVFYCDTHGKQAHETLAGARASAAGNPRALVYAITPEGKTIHVPATYPAEG